jgi:hypothetical protein
MKGKGEEPDELASRKRRGGWLIYEGRSHLRGPSHPLYGLVESRQGFPLTDALKTERLPQETIIDSARSDKGPKGPHRGHNRVVNAKPI